jgi:polyisoprenoid-binding protein YceI
MAAEWISNSGDSSASAPRSVISTQARRPTTRQRSAEASTTLLRAAGLSSDFIRSATNTVRHLKALLGILVIASRILDAETAIVELRPAVSGRMDLTVEKTGRLAGKKHLFTFSQSPGTLRFARETPETSTVEFAIEAGTILCRDTWLSVKDLHKVQQYAVQDMLAAAKYPRVRFRSTTVRKQNASHYDVDGILTVRDVAKPIVVAVSLITGPGNEISIEGTARVRLTDFGLKPPSAAFGAIGTRDDMTLHFALPATLPAETSSLP